MILARELERKIVDFICAIPDFEDVQTQKDVIKQALLPEHVKQQVMIGMPPRTTAPLLVKTLLNCGTLDDGRYAIEVLLMAARSFVDEKDQILCDYLISEVVAARQE